MYLINMKTTFPEAQFINTTMSSSIPLYFQAELAKVES